MRQIAKELVRSGGDTDLQSQFILGSKENQSKASPGEDEIVQIGRSIGIAHRKELLKQIGELEDESFGDGEASRQSSKQLILGDQGSELPFGMHLDDSSNNCQPESPKSVHVNEDQMKEYKLMRLSRNKSGMNLTKVKTGITKAKK